jgi:uncharacterized protein (TIGR03086 family)
MLNVALPYVYTYDQRMHTIADLRPFHRSAVLASVDVVAHVASGDLGRPTPCADWDLGDLLTHMTVQHNGFAAAARGAGADPRVWDSAAVVDAVRAEPAATYAAAAADVLDAFAADGALDATFALPEFGPNATFPGRMAIGFHFVDYVAHGWDVARSIAMSFELPSDVVAAALPLALLVPDGEHRSEENAFFGPALPADGDVTNFDRMLLHLGRSPDWKCLRTPQERTSIDILGGRSS